MTPSTSADFDHVVDSWLAKHHASVFWGDRLLSLDKSTSFLTEPAFRDAFASIFGNHQYDQYKSPHTVAWRLHVLCWSAQQSLSLNGDFVECGTFKGDFAWVINRVVRPASREKKFYLYDSFEGFAPTDQTVDSAYADFANPIYREKGIFDSVQSRFAQDQHVVITKGFLPETLQKAAPAVVSFLHMDLNSPGAELASLEFFWPRIVPGGVVVFDDYGWKVFAKQKELEDHFARERNHSILELPTGQGLLVKHPAG